ncbi:hypothetical protein NQ318_016923 [Aromia moschata]|uniref:cystathionine gamma-lyase n=1 Tax=Aromia moschata TaxID=1265417 RepID=A0AAV8X7N4_9CUCU|nr:hypothetical protein NQ318_016923 [Aromia moschata]
MGEKEGFLPFPRDFEMICVHHSTKVDTQSPCKGIVPPLVLSNFHEPKGSCEPSSLSRYVPARLGNSTRFALEKVVALLNRAKHCLCFASGIGAIGAILALLKTGDHVIISDDVYGGTTESIMRLNKFCIQCSHVDFHHMENVENAITPETKGGPLV